MWKPTTVTWRPASSPTLRKCSLYHSSYQLYSSSTRGWLRIPSPSNARNLTGFILCSFDVAAQNLYVQKPSHVQRTAFLRTPPLPLVLHSFCFLFFHLLPQSDLFLCSGDTGGKGALSKGSCHFVYFKWRLREINSLVGTFLPSRLSLGCFKQAGSGDDGQKCRVVFGRQIFRAFSSLVSWLCSSPFPDCLVSLLQNR